MLSSCEIIASLCLSFSDEGNFSVKVHEKTMETVD